MQMLMIIAPEEEKERVEAVLSDLGVLGFTEIPTAYGTGRSGLRMGSRAFPATSSVLFTVVERAKAGEVVDALRNGRSGAEGSVRLVLWGVERMV